MKPKIIILGAHGMLGWQVLNKFKKSKLQIKCQVRNNKSKHNLIRKLNLNKKVQFFYYDVEKDKIEKLYKQISKNDIIINCIGKIKPFINENNLNEINAAIKVNSLFPNNLSKIIDTKNVKIYQIATDCVFSGINGNYDESSKHDALDVYGKSKSLGEVNKKNFFNIRVSIIGKELNTKNSLVEWFLSNKNSFKIFGFTDHLWNGVTTNVFAELLLTIIEKNIQLPSVFHLVPKDKVNKCVLLNYLKDHFQFENLKVIKKNSKMKINRVLLTKNENLNNNIWNKSSYKRKLTIKEIVSTI